MIREAKAKGLHVTCDVGVNYLKYTDQDLGDYDTNLKVNPPYRLEEDRKALVEGVLDGTIDVVVSDHNPHDEECKKLEFDLADFGSANQQPFYSIASGALGKGFDEIIQQITTKPRNILGLEVPKIEEGAEACLTLFSPTASWTLNSKTNKSKSVASPAFNQAMNGKIIGIVNKGELRLNNYED